MNPPDQDRKHLDNSPPGDGPRHSAGPPDGWLRPVLENTSEIVTIVDPDGTLRYANPAFERILGYDPEGAVGKMNVLDYVHPEDLPHVLEETEEALSRRGVATNKAEYRFRDRGGSWRWMESSGTYLLGDPHVRGVVVTSRDVTGRVRTGERLRFQAQLLGSVGEAVVALDTDGRVVYWNRAAEETYGWSAEEALGRRLKEMVVPEDLRGRADEIMSEVRAGSTWTGEFVVRRRDGTLFPAEATNTPIFGEDGGLAGVISVFRDVSDRKKAEEALRQSEAELFSVLESITDGFFILDREWRFAYVNRQAEAMMERAREDLVGERVRADFTFYPRYREAVAENKTVSFEGYYPPVGKWYSVRAYPSRSGLSVYFQDVTGRREAEEKLRRNEASLSEAQRLAHLGSWGWDVETDEVWWSEETFRIYGFEPGETLPSLEKFMEVVHPDDRGMLGAAIDSALHEHESYDLEHRVVRPGGEVRVVHRRAEVVGGRDGRVLRMVGTAHDITERKSLENRLVYQALHDPLTELPNRQLFEERLGQALGRTRCPKNRRAAVLFMDLDNFKSINDSLGHEVGDLLLVVVAERLKRCLRPEDTVARFGGDEFVVLLESVEGADEAVRVAERIAEAFRRPFVPDSRELYISTSIGIALDEDRSENPADLLRSADTAMYEAKAGASSGYRVFDPDMHERVLKRLELKNDLRLALEREEFRLFYQPKVRLGERDKIVEVEALLRWEHPRLGLLPPDEFVPLAEETGLILPIGRWVLRETCRQLKRWQERFPRRTPLIGCVNVSAGQLRYPDLLHDVGAALREGGIEAKCLALEITESALVEDMPTSMTLLRELREQGIRFALDDFGSEYSSLSYLRRLPVDFVKIDKSFVWSLGEDPRAEVIVEAIVSLAHSLGLEAVGEGVENAEQLAILRDMGCDLVQGFYLGEPLPGEELDRLLAD